MTSSILNIFETGQEKTILNQYLYLKHFFRVPFVAQWLAYPTRNHEVAGMSPGLAQWVKDPALPGAVV